MSLRLPPPLHRWNLSPRQAIALQRRLAPRIRIEPLSIEPRLIAGLDAAFSDGGKVCVAAVVLWDLETGSVREEHVACRPVRFPYIPGLLSFREAPALLAALRKLSTAPDVLMCDGHGIAHPRRFGIACHLGLLCDLPTFGCAKSILVGEPDSVGNSRGAVAELRFQGEVTGNVLRTQPGIRPVYVSPGHLLDQRAATAIALSAVTGHRLPEPTHRADRRVARSRRIPGGELDAKSKLSKPKKIG